jgi:hypothetical protein
MRPEGSSAGNILVVANKQLEADVDTAVRTASTLYDEMVADLDTDKYGFGWWNGYMDQRRIALISEYLIGSVVGVRDALGNAAFSFEHWTEQQHADDMWVRQVLHSLGPGAADEDILLALRRTGNDHKRNVRIRLAAEHLYYHLAQTFDRLAAVVIGICALDASILKADWSVISKDEKFKRATSDGKRGGQPAAGATVQADLRAKLLDVVAAAGPVDWWDWVDGRRNTNAHRAPKIQMILTHRDSKKKPTRLLHLLERQPRWSMTEELVGNEGESMEEIWLMTDPATIHTGCVRSTASVVLQALELLTDLWHQRKGDTTLLVQPAGQWSSVLEQPLLKFDGYSGDPVALPKNDVVRVSPDTGRRMKATGVFDDSFWATAD